MSAQIINLIAKRALKDVAKKEINSKVRPAEDCEVAAAGGRDDTKNFWRRTPSSRTCPSVAEMAIPRAR